MKWGRVNGDIMVKCYRSLREHCRKGPVWQLHPDNATGSFSLPTSSPRICLAVRILSYPSRVDRATRDITRVINVDVTGDSSLLFINKITGAILLITCLSASRFQLLYHPNSFWVGWFRRWMTFKEMGLKTSSWTECPRLHHVNENRGFTSSVPTHHTVTHSTAIMSAGQKRPFPNGNHKQDSSQLPLPPRWLKCPRKGLPIIDKFIPFKTPLDSKYDDQVPEEDRFTFDFFINSLAARKIKLGG